MTSSHPEDVPPPPYSETDLFSASGRDAHLADDASRSTSSTNGEVIYTPPLTPRSAHQSNFAGEVDHVLGSAAAAYFETRPAPSPLNSQPHITHSLTLTSNSTPDALPYPRNLATRDIRLEDWQTFINYLIPHHSATSNEQIIDRKLRAEAMTATVTTHTAAANDDARSQSSGRSHAEAQLNRVRSPVVDTDAAQQRENVGATVREWNDGFFTPRRVTIHVDLEPTAPTDNKNNSNASSRSNLNEVPPQPDQHHMPGAWDQSFDQPDPASADRNTPGGGRRGFFSHFAGRGGRGGGHHGHGGSGGGGGGGGGGFRFAGINVENDRVSIGNTFVADGRTGSVRIGGIVADGNGISINGQPMFGGAGLPGRGRGGFLPGRGRCGTGPPGWGAGGGPGGWGSWGGHGRGAWGRGGGGPWGRGGWWGGGDRSGPEDAGEHGRGRGEHKGPPHRHGRSRSSSASSISSRSSVRSDSSAGSLPDYDDLKDSQLPVARQVLQDSLHHPEQPITKEKVKEIRAQLKAAKHSADPASMAFDKAALRHEVKELLRNWKSLKKEQKRSRKQLRRDLKQRHRQEKRERRQVKRELKHAARQMKRDMRRGAWGHSHHHPPHPPHAPHAPHAPHPPHPPHPPHGHHGHHMPPMPPMPAMPAMPAMPHMPHMPAMPHGVPPPPGYDTPWNTREVDDGTTSRTPGAWPSDDKHQHEHDEGVAAYPYSQAKYQAAWEMEAKVAEKEAELTALHERLVEEEHHQDSNGKGGMSKMEAEAVAVEREIEELGRELERLRTEADEEFARELEKEEERAYRG